MPIGQQRFGNMVTVTPDTGIPSGDEANRLVIATAFNVNLVPTCWQFHIQITAAGAFEADLYAWGREPQYDQWGRLGSSNGHMNGGTVLEGTTADGWWFVYQNIEVFGDLYIEQANLVGAPTINIRLFPMYEQAVELRGL
jgi:hypothetical protein